MDGLLHDVLVGVLITLAGAAILGFFGWVWRAGKRVLDKVSRMESELVMLRDEVRHHKDQLVGATNDFLLIDRQLSDLMQGAATAGQLMGYRREVDAKLEGYERDQTALSKEVARLGDEINILHNERADHSFRITDLEQELAPVRESLAVPVPGSIESTLAMVRELERQRREAEAMGLE